jgi:acyl-CoA synthetase (AMP-forming)/AMP-acid ligase II
VQNPAQSIKVLAKSGIIRPLGPRTLLGTALALKSFGLGPAGGFQALALRAPRQVGLVDELGSLTFGQMNDRANALAGELAKLGVRPGDGIGIMCRNHRGFVDISLAAAKLGADMLYLNTAFAGPQLAEVIVREKPTVVVYDQEFTDLLAGVSGVKRLLAWVDTPSNQLDDLESLIRRGAPTTPKAPPKPGRIVILTSGTTGTPKGAPRTEAGIDAAAALLSRIPLRRADRTYIAAPLFHTWGLAHLLMGMLLETQVVLTRRFEPEEFLRVLDEQRCDAAVVIPVFLQRTLQLPDDVKAKYDLSKLRVVASSGSALTGDLAQEWMDQFGDNLYNTYGSTEVAYATIATPEDLRSAPGTAGKPPLGAVVKLYDDADRPSVPGESGRIFVGNGMLFEGYTGGGGKATIDGLMSSGDVGRFDGEGRLFVEGRDDDMIVSGGENLFPQEIEDCLTRHDAVVEAAAIGVDDETFGKRLRAFVVLEGQGPGSQATEDELKDWVKTNLARFKVPREIVFLPELPRNATGKILKRELSAWSADNT